MAENFLHFGVEKIKPGYHPIRDCMIVGTADGWKITVWNGATLGPRPTDAALEASGREYYAQMQAEKEAAEAKRQQILAVLAALDAGTATAAQVQKVLAFLVRRVLS